MNGLTCTSGRLYLMGAHQLIAPATLYRTVWRPLPPRCGPATYTRHFRLNSEVQLSVFVSTVYLVQSDLLYAATT
jgi:hypothetical protein